MKINNILVKGLIASGVLFWLILIAGVLSFHNLSHFWTMGKSKYAVALVSIELSRDARSEDVYFIDKLFQNNKFIIKSGDSEINQIGAAIVTMNNDDGLDAIITANKSRMNVNLYADDIPRSVWAPLWDGIIANIRLRYTDTGTTIRE